MRVPREIAPRLICACVRWNVERELLAGCKFCQMCGTASARLLLTVQHPWPCRRPCPRSSAAHNRVWPVRPGRTRAGDFRAPARVTDRRGGRVRVAARRKASAGAPQVRCRTCPRPSEARARARPVRPSRAGAGDFRAPARVADRRGGRVRVAARRKASAGAPQVRLDTWPRPSEAQARPREGGPQASPTPATSRRRRAHPQAQRRG